MAIIDSIKSGVDPLMDELNSGGGAFSYAIDTYLMYNMTVPGAIAHWGIMTTSGLLNANPRLLNAPKNPWSQGSEGGLSALSSLTDASQEAIDFVNKIYELSKDPNIEGIPIRSSHITCTRETQVSDYGVIMGEGYYNKHITDNATPMPRSWEITGYLASIWDADIGLNVKPSITMQVKVLDAFAKSRRPLWFKNADGDFIPVQITSLVTDESPEVMNARSIKLQVKEFVPLELLNNASTVRKAVYAFSH